MDVIKLYTPEVPEGQFPMTMADVSGVKRKFLDVAYADRSKNQKMDIYLPDEGVGPFPVIVFIHGGAFWGGERRDFQMHYVINGIRRGYVVVSLDHRLSDEAKFPEPVYDVKAAIRFLRANASTYLMDTDRIGVCGASAGGYMVTMLGATGDMDAFEDRTMGNAEYSSAVQAVISLFGVHDPVMQSQFTEDAPPFAPGAPKMANFMDIFMDFNCREKPALAMMGWPGNYITPACPPMLIQAGSADEIVPYQNSIDLADKINAVCGDGRAIFETFPDCKHGDPAFSTPEAEERRFQFFDSILKK